MKVETKVRDIQRSSSFEEKAMGLAKGSEAFVFNVLRKDLYSDPIGSLIREYAVNAQDEHRKFGKTDVPILIQVPNQFTPELHIRDYAGGLTEEQVFEFFGNYGASDKRDTNDAVGFFGLGCKSAFAYTDSYIVKSFKDGMVYTFNIYIDETEIGKTAKISAEPTDEPNGIEIIVPVKTYDISTFQRKVISTVSYFKTKPVIKGMAEEVVFDTKAPVIKGDDWEFFGNGTPTVIMGEIPYPVDRYKMGDNLESWESTLLNSDIDIYVGIGDVQVTASREALQMTPKTVAAIREKLATIKDTMIAETEKAFAQAKNLIEVKQLWHSTIGSGTGYANILRSYGKGIEWKGEKIDSNIIELDGALHGVTTYHYAKRNSTVIKVYNSANLICKSGEKIYFDDTDGANIRYKRRARTLLMEGVKDVILIRTTDKTALETFLGMSVTELLSFNAVAETKADSARQGTGLDAGKKVKHLSKVFVLNRNTLKGYYGGAASEVWEVKEVDTTSGGVYIPIERFKPIDIPTLYGSLETLASILHAAEQAGIKINVPIYGIKKGGDTTGLVRFDEWLTAQVKKRKKLLKDYSMVKAYTDYDLCDMSNLSPSMLPDGSIAKTYTTLYNRISKLASYRDSKYKILRYTNINVTTDKRVKDLSKQFETKYPMLKFVSSHYYREPEVVSYIENMEKN